MRKMIHSLKSVSNRSGTKGRYLVLSGLVAVLLAIYPTSSLSSNSDLRSYAVIGQTPNNQIVNSNTGYDSNAWERFSITTYYSPYSVSNTKENAYTNQMDTYVDGCNNSCTSPTDANWLQAIEGIDGGNLVGQNGGYWLHDAHLEVFWYDGSQSNPQQSASICQASIPQLVNMDQTGYSTTEQAQITSLGMNLTVTASDNNGNLLYRVTSFCSDPIKRRIQHSLHIFVPTRRGSDCWLRAMWQLRIVFSL